MIGLGAVDAVAAYGDDAADLVKGHNLNNKQPSPFYVASLFTHANQFLLTLHCSRHDLPFSFFFFLFLLCFY